MFARQIARKVAKKIMVADPVMLSMLLSSSQDQTLVHQFAEQSRWQLFLNASASRGQDICSE